MAIPEGYTFLAKLGIAYKGDYSEEETYEKFNAVYYNGSTFIALVDNPDGPPIADGANWQYMAQGFLSQVISNLTATDKNGVIGEAGKTVNAQELIDGISDDLKDKLDKTGDASNTTATFEQASERTNIISGESHKTIFGKIKKWFSDMTAAAFAQIISSNTDLMATTVAGYLVDALAVKQQFDVVNSNLSLETRARMEDFATVKGDYYELSRNLIDGTVNHKTSQRLLSAALTTNNKTMVSSENKNVYIGNEEIEHIFFQLKNETINFDTIRSQVLTLGTFDDNIPIDTHLKNMFSNILPTDVFCHGHFTWRGTRTFEAFVYSDKRYGYIKTTNWDGREISIDCNDSNFYYYENNDNYCSTIVTENISSSVDTYANSDGVFINVKDSRVKQADTISDIEVWDCLGRGATTYSSLEIAIIYDGGFVISVKNLNIIGNYLYRIRYRVTRKQI